MLTKTLCRYLGDLKKEDSKINHVFRNDQNYTIEYIEFNGSLYAIYTIDLPEGGME